MPDRFDVCVAGAGGAGLAAALAAAETGATVLLLEAAPEIGGTTARSIGSLMAAPPGGADSPEAHLADLRRLCDAERGDDRQLAQLAQWAPELVGWLARHGVTLSPAMPETGHSRPRMRMLGPTPREALRVLREAALERGAQVRTGARMTGLARALDGWRVSIGSAVTARASAVILACGDASAAVATSRRPPMNPYARGDAIALAEAAGGVPVAVRHTSVAFRRYAYPHIELRPVVYELGARLVTAADEPVTPAVELPERYYFVAFDDASLRRITAADPQVCTYPALGYARWSDLLARGEVGFSDGAARIGPFATFTALTDGGLRVGADLSVLDAGGEPVRGLYAAGAAAWGPLRLHGHGHHLSWTFASGMVAGRVAAG